MHLVPDIGMLIGRCICNFVIDIVVLFVHANPLRIDEHRDTSNWSSEVAEIPTLGSVVKTCEPIQIL
jgi:hypothetical protein